MDTTSIAFGMMLLKMEDMESQIEQLRINRGRMRAERLTNDPTVSKDNPSRIKRDDGIFGVLMVQCIIGVVIAILYVVCMTVSESSASNILTLIQDKSANDFSYGESVYKTVNSFVSFLNREDPATPSSNTGEAGSSVNAGTSSATSEESDPPSSTDPANSSSTPSSKEESDPDEDQNGAGGAVNPVLSQALPSNVVFSPAMFIRKLTFPIKDAYRVTSQFGYRNHPIEDVAEFHLAADLAAPKGTPIYAAASGTIVRAAQGPTLGNYIWIDHGDGFFTIYGHCDRLLCKAGDKIKEGDIIAEVGSTGNSTGNHLHFGMKKDGMYFDPSYVFAAELNVEA